jgi:hypothetical protein
MAYFNQLKSLCSGYGILAATDESEFNLKRKQVHTELYNRLDDDKLMSEEKSTQQLIHQNLNVVCNRQEKSATTKLCGIKLLRSLLSRILDGLGEGKRIDNPFHEDNKPLSNKHVTLLGYEKDVKDICDIVIPFHQVLLMGCESISIVDDEKIGAMYFRANKREDKHTLIELWCHNTDAAYDEDLLLRGYVLKEDEVKEKSDTGSERASLIETPTKPVPIDTSSPVMENKMRKMPKVTHSEGAGGRKDIPEEEDIEQITILSTGGSKAMDIDSEDKKPQAGTKRDASSISKSGKRITTYDF